MKTLTKISTKTFKKILKKTMRALFQIDQVQPKAVLVLLLLAPVMLSSCKNFDYSFPEIADDAKPRHVYYKAGECESPFVATLPTDKTDYIRTETPTLKDSPVACKNGNLEKSFSHWDITYSNSNGEHQPGDKIPFTRHGKYFNATAVWECMRETYDLDGGTGEIIPACKEPKAPYSLSDGKDKDGKFVYKEGYYLESWQVVNNGDSTGTVGSNGLNDGGWKAPDDDTKAMPTLKAVWKPVEVTVTLNKNGYGTQNVTSPQRKAYTDTVEIPVLTQVGYNFDGWQNGSSTASTGNSVAISSLWDGVTNGNETTKDIALTAQWSPKPVTVTYDANSATTGTAPTESSTLKYNHNYTLKPKGNLAKTGHTFEGWCTNATCSGHSYNAGVNKELNQTNFKFANTSVATLTTTLYAKWKPIPVTGVTISPNSNNANNPIVVAQGSSTYLTAVITPSNANNKNVTWAVNPAVTGISVDVNGKVSVANTVSVATTATITVTTDDGSKTATAYIKVVKVSPEAMVAVPTNGSTAITFPMKDDDSATGEIKKGFSMSQTEVTYELWKRVYHWANKDAGTCDPATGQYCYTFANAGWKGGTKTNGKYVENSAGTVKQPVVKVSWRDVIVWSNAYTEWYNAEKSGSLTVVYYTDGSYTTPLRTSTNNSHNSSAGSEDKPYIKASSNDNTDMAKNIATGFRLPTSQEWGFAARLRTDNVYAVASGTPSGVTATPITMGGTKYWFTKGNAASGGSKAYSASPTDIGDFAWYRENSCDDGTGCSSNGTGTKQSKTHDVGTKTANALGIYDMSGNVWEWCFDIESSGMGVYRGGSWGYNPYDLGVGYVRGIMAMYPWGFIGFRVVRTQ